MEAKELLKLAHSIYQAFDPSSTGHNHTEDIVFEAFRGEIETVRDAISGDKESETFDNLLYGDIPWAFFGLGYAVGQMVDLTDRESLAIIKVIQQEIRENELLPYLPRERRAP